MADRFCEPGIYEACIVSANTTNNNSTLTVTAVTSGRIGLGARITGSGIPANTFISALGTGRGGAGTYTMNRAATATQTGVTIVSQAGTPALDPEWGAAQEGDGLAKGVATPALAHIVFTGTPSGAISVCGVSISPAWGSGADAAANGLATAINAATGSVTTESYNAGVQLRNAMWARGPAGGAPAGTCQIMTRAGSSMHNGLVAIAHTLTNVNDVASSLSFSGGASGSWGHLLNGRTTAWPSALARAAYGLWCSTQPFVGSQAGHTVHIRADVPVISTEASATCRPAASVSPNEATRTVNVVDDGTHWPSSLNARLQLDTLPSGGAGFYLNFQDQFNFNVMGRVRPLDGKYTLNIREIGSSFGGLGINPGLGNSSIQNLDMEVLYNLFTAPAISSIGAPSGAGHRFLVRNVRFASPAPSTFFNVFSSVFLTSLRLENVVVDNAGATGAHPGVFGTPGSNPGEVIGRNIRFVNFVPGSRLMPPGTVGPLTTVRVLLENCEFAGITNLGPAITQSTHDAYRSYVSYFSQFGLRDFFVDSVLGYVDWNGSLGFPTLNATLPDGVTKWAIRLIPTTLPGCTSVNNYLESPRIGKINALATGQRTITVEFCLSDQLAWTKNDVSMLVTYLGSDGNLVTLDTHDPDGGALTPSTLTWSQETGGKVTFISGGMVYHSKYKLSVTTPVGQNLPLGEEVGVHFRIHNTVGNTSQMAFVDPDVSIA